MLDLFFFNVSPLNQQQKFVGDRLIILSHVNIFIVNVLFFSFSVGGELCANLSYYCLGFYFISPFGRIRWTHCLCGVGQVVGRLTFHLFVVLTKTAMQCYYALNRILIRNQTKRYSSILSYQYFCLFVTCVVCCIV